MEPVKIRKLLKNIAVQAVKGSKEVEITGITSNSKLVAPGHLFIAKKGLTVDGARFISDAVAAGAVAVLTDLYDPFFPHITQIIHPDVPAAEAVIAKAFYASPSDRLLLVGVTGTNGKTTTSYLIRHLMEKRGKCFGLIGTVEWIVGHHIFPAEQTTPALLQNYKLFHEMIAVGCEGCVMEVSSHALDQGRVAPLEFDIAVFTNLTQDHLDYHKTMEEYARAKAKLFTSLKAGIKPFPKVAVVNADCAYSLQMMAECTAERILYGIDGPCDLRASSLCLSAEGVEFDIAFRGTECHFRSALIGRHNVYNLLAAIGVGLAQGIPLSACATALEDFSKIPGRLERVPNTVGLNIFVDYAHTEDALLNVLKALWECKKGRLIVVFGCGGDRDAPKRPKMGEVVEAHADLAVITSDNPRSENPEAIIRAILPGLKHPERAMVIVDREQAIWHAVHSAHTGDTILIAGKGHENFQIFSHHKIPFDDRDIAAAACLGRAAFYLR
jgi:UDP-N-acetylmuramoyl-L-alanyl-D-glutamate--2,6-diaminopimelate ligase